MMSGTGCLGFSLRTTVLIAGVFTLIESITWVTLSAVSYMAWKCVFNIPKDLSLNLRLTFILYYLNTECHTQYQDFSDLTPENFNENIVVGEGGVNTAYRTSLISIVYIISSIFWMVASLMLLGTILGRLTGVTGARLCYPWIIVTSATMVFDLIAMGFYASDSANFYDIANVETVSNVTIPNKWLTAMVDQGFALKSGSLIMLAVMVRGIVFWLLNGVLLVHVVRGVKAIVSVQDFGDAKDSPPSREATPIPVEPSAPPPMPTSDEPTEPLHVLGAEGLLGPIAVPVLPALPKRVHSTGGSPRPPRTDHRLGSDRRSASQSQMDVPMVLRGRLSARMQNVHPSHNNHLERTPSQRSVTGAVVGPTSVAIEAKINQIMSSVHAEPAREETDRFHQRTTPEGYEDFFPEDDPVTWQDAGREYGRYASVELPESQPRRMREFEDASPRRRQHLSRTNSERTTFVGDWHLGQRPPGNLHNLSPLHSPIKPYHVDPGHIQEATEELKRERPWSYLTNANDQDRGIVDRNFRSPHSPSSGVVHNRVYLLRGRPSFNRGRSQAPDEENNSGKVLYNDCFYSSSNGGPLLRSLLRQAQSNIEEQNVRVT